MKKNKKIKYILLSGLIALNIISLSGCTKKEEAKKNDIKVTLVLDEGGINDQSFNQSAYEGAMGAKEKYNVDINYLEAKQESDYKTNIETAVDEEPDLIIGVGFKLGDAIKEAAKNYPEQKFAIIDASYKDVPDNLRCIIFNEEESGYLAGLVAGKTSKANNFGFIGGMDIPSVTNFAIGFEKGLKEVNPNSKLAIQYANSFTDAAKGKAIASQMYKDDIDIIFTAGGGVNSGVYEVAKENNKLVVAVDMPQNYILPDTILTSALKNVGVGVELTVKDLVEDNFKGGEIVKFDLQNNGVGYEKTNLIPKEVIEFVDSKISK